LALKLDVVCRKDSHGTKAPCFAGFAGLYLFYVISFVWALVPRNDRHNLCFKDNVILNTELLLNITIVFLKSGKARL